MKDVLTDDFEIIPFGDKGIRLQFSTEISAEVNQWIRSFSILLEEEKLSGVVEWIPTYTALSIMYEPHLVSYVQLTEQLMQIKEKLEVITLPQAEIIQIPTCYGGELGPDLESVAQYHGLSEDDVIRIHSKNQYLIYMLGFTPGFPYLGGLDPQIATPRLANPRAKVLRGSVGIGGELTGIYSLATPGGWQIIGRTPLLLFDPRQEHPILLKAGDYLQFIPISESEYKQIEVEVEYGTYQVIKEKKV